MDAQRLQVKFSSFNDLNQSESNRISLRNVLKSLRRIILYPYVDYDHYYILLSLSSLYVQDLKGTSRDLGQVEEHRSLRLKLEALLRIERERVGALELKVEELQRQQQVPEDDDTQIIVN